MTGRAPPVRWGVLGAAAIATSRFLPSLREAPSAVLHAVASRDAAKARAVAQRFGAARAWGSYDALLADADVEAVYVPLPNDLHVAWTLRALAAGKHVLCEKPLCLTAADAATLIEARDRAGRLVEEAFSYRNHPQWERIARVLADGTIGAPRAVHAALAKQFHDPADIRNDPARGGGALYDLGAYAISACSLVLGRAPRRVLACVDRDPVLRIDRLTSALLDYGGTHATFTVGTQSGPAAWASHQQFTVIGAQGFLRADFPFAHGRPAPCRVEVGDAGSHGSVATRGWDYAPVNQYALQAERFSRALRGDDVPRWPLEDAQRTLAVIEALRRSEAQGGWAMLAPAA